MTKRKEEHIWHRSHRSDLVRSRQGRFKGNRNQQNSLSNGEHGKVEIGEEILFRISREFATKGEVMNGEKKNQEWLSFLLLARSLANL